MPRKEGADGERCIERKAVLPTYDALSSNTARLQGTWRATAGSGEGYKDRTGTVIGHQSKGLNLRRAQTAAQFFRLPAMAQQAQRPEIFEITFSPALGYWNNMIGIPQSFPRQPFQAPVNQ